MKGKAILCPCDYDFYKEFSKEEREKIFNGEMTDKNDVGSFSRYLYNKQDETNPEKGWNNQLYFSHYNPKTKEGVPFTFLEYYNPDQFEILGITATNDRNVDIIRTNDVNTNRGVINGKELYARIIIKNKQPEKY